MSIKNVHAVTPAQCRAARALLDMTQSELAAAAGLGLSTIVDFEKGRRQVSNNGIRAIQSALERAGLRFDKGVLGVATMRTAFADVSDIFVAEKAEKARNAQKSHLGEKLKKKRWLASTQIRAARALLKWSTAELAQASALGVNTIRRAEAAEKETALTAANELAIRRALETAGVVFIDENGGGAGVRLRHRKPERGRK
jgi:transcriptional regulator with XRE-family HTH domain